MRTFLFAVAATAVIASPATAQSRNFGISSFTKIRVEGPYKVTVATGIAPFAKAVGSPAATDRVAVEVRGDTLIVHNNPSWGGYPGSNPGPVEVSVGTHDLESVTLMGSGAVAVDRVKGLKFALSIQGSGAGSIDDVQVDQFSADIGGTSSVKLGGRTGKLTVLVRGLSSLDAKRLSTPSADISGDGSATIDATVTDTARVNAWGPATIRLDGRPTCDLKVSGSAGVTGCR